MTSKNLPGICLSVVLWLSAVNVVFSMNLLVPPISKHAAKAHQRINNEALTFDYKVYPWYKHRKDGKPGREIMLYFIKDKLKQDATITVEWNGLKENLQVSPVNPLDSLSVLLPAGAGLKETQVEITLFTDHRKSGKIIGVSAKKHWKVYIYPHSHVDVGYTNLQEVVEKLHVRNIDVAIDIAKKTQHYPEGAKFVWNPEATWVVSSYLKNADLKQKQSFTEAVRKGWIQIDGAHSNINTSTCSDEELLRMFKNSHAIESLTGVPVTTMVQMDNPGGGWGLVQAAAQNGIRGFFSYPNYFDLRQRWENKPFYWMSQDGKNRIFFLQATSYGYGFKAKGRKYGLGKIQAFTDEYDRLSTDTPLENFIDPFIFEETGKLEKANSPYDIFAMTWSMADNCLIDADLPEAVKQWNEKFAYPKLIISGSKGILEAYEKEYKSIIPEYKGDFTEFWTQGLGSDARRVGMSRRGKENLVQAETLWPLLNKTKPAPIEAFNAAWENALLASEHTWGYQDPKAPLAKKVEANKAAFFENTEKSSAELISKAVKSVEDKNSPVITVVNTLSWSRGGLVTLSHQQSTVGDIVVDSENHRVLSQRLSTGELVFEAGMIPALGSKYFKILSGKLKKSGKMIKGKAAMSNQLISVVLDKTSGNIKSLVDSQTGRELADPDSPFSMNSYNYLAGVKNGKPADSIRQVIHPENVTIQIKENGPLVASLLVSSTAESCNWLTREVKIVKNQRFVELINTVDKIADRKKESIHFGFAFNVPSGVIRMDIPLGVMTPEKDQIPYANKNWFAFQRWINISNKDYGVTWTAIEAPIVEFGSITGTILDGARQASTWLKEVPETQTIISWPVNNHWDTNFPLEQEGVIALKYVIMPHGTFDPAVSNRFGVEKHRPLIAIQTKESLIIQSPVAIDNPRVMISTLKRSEDNKALILRLRSVSDKTENISLSWPSGAPRFFFRCLSNEEPLENASDVLSLKPYEIISLRIEQ